MELELLVGTVPFPRANAFCQTMVLCPGYIEVGDNFNFPK